MRIRLRRCMKLVQRLQHPGLRLRRITGFPRCEERCRKAILREVRPKALYVGQGR